MLSYLDMLLERPLKVGRDVMDFTSCFLFVFEILTNTFRLPKHFYVTGHKTSDPVWLPSTVGSFDETMLVYRSFYKARILGDIKNIEFVSAIPW